MWTSFVFTCHGRAVPDNFQVLALVEVVPPPPRHPVPGTVRCLVMRYGASLWCCRDNFLPGFISPFNHSVNASLAVSDKECERPLFYLWHLVINGHEALFRSR